MRLLLDTHSFLWYITNSPRLPRHAYDVIRDKSNEAFLSVVSVWEVLVKHKIGKLPLPVPADEYIESRRTAHRIANLDLQPAAVAQLLSLPDFHRDPFDRVSSAFGTSSPHEGRRATMALRCEAASAASLRTLSRARRAA